LSDPLTKSVPRKIRLLKEALLLNTLLTRKLMRESFTGLFQENLD